MTLVECLVSMAMSVLVIMALISLLLHNAKIANASNKRRLLIQSTHSVVQMMKQDLYRAGYGGELGQSIKVLGADDVYHIISQPNTSLVAYAYLAGELGTEEAYTNVVYQRDERYPNQLRICEIKLPRVMSRIEAQAFNAHFGNTCNTLFDHKQILVTAFDVNKQTLIAGSTLSQLLLISVTTALTRWPEKNISVSFSIRSRNP